MVVLGTGTVIEHYPEWFIVSPLANGMEFPLMYIACYLGFVMAYWPRATAKIKGGAKNESTAAAWFLFGAFGAALALGATACGASESSSKSPAPAATSGDFDPAVIASGAAFAASSAPPSSSVAPHVIRKSLVMSTRPSGESVLTFRADGAIESHFEVRENGRGQLVEATVRLADDGTLASFDATGHETAGTPIDEHFSRQGRHVRWKNTAESGEKDIDGPAFYVPLASTIETYGFLAQALLTNGGTLPLLPAGEARIERTSEYAITTANASTQLPRKLIGYAIYGLGFEPVRVWLDESGSPVAYVDAWEACIVEGLEKESPALLRLQEELDAKRNADLVARLAHHPPAEGLAITHARVLDVVAGKWIPDTTVIIKGEKIIAIGPSARTLLPQGAEVLDATGKALIPGLWDMHAHFGESDGLLNIAAGVTTARDVGNDPDRLDAYKDSFDHERAIGPHLLRAGFIEGRGEKAAASVITAETPDEARAAVAFYKARGYDQIKIYNSMKPELVPILAQAAHAAGMRVSGHVPAFMRAEDVVRAGYDEINHVNMLFLNFFVDKDTDTRSILRISLVAEKAGGLDLRSKPVLDFLRLLRERKTTVDPTLSVYEGLLVDRVGELGPGIKTAAARLPVQARRQFLLGGLPVPAGKDAQYKESFEALLHMVKALHDNGIPFAAGTDNLAGFMLHREIELYKRAGLTNAEAIAAATISPAKIMRKDATTGSVAVGKEADLALLTGDPLANIEDIRHVVRTIRAGVSYDANEIDRELGVVPASP